MPLEDRRAEQAFWTVELTLVPAVLERSGLDPEEARTRIQTHVDSEAQTDKFDKRWVRLQSALDAGSRKAAHEYAADYGLGGVRRFEAGDGSAIWQMKLETFPGHLNNVYVVLKDDSKLLWDVGSGADSSTRDFEVRFAVFEEFFESGVGLKDLDTAIISHGHLDHYGGAEWMRNNSSAKLYIHELDYRVVANFDDRLAVASRDISRYLTDVGVPDAERKDYMEMYTATKDMYNSVPLDGALADNDTIGPGYEIIHVPGHCPGLICLRVGDVLLAADHILARITPLQSPEVITPYTGLGHYFDSLTKVGVRDDIRLTLPAHETPIDDLSGRAEEIREHHNERLDQVVEMCGKAKTIFEVSREMFGTRDGYARILAVLEAGAHVEYLFLRGALRVANPHQVATTDDAIRYLR